MFTSRAVREAFDAVTGGPDVGCFQHFGGRSSSTFIPESDPLVAGSPASWVGGWIKKLLSYSELPGVPCVTLDQADVVGSSWCGLLLWHLSFGCRSSWFNQMVEGYLRSSLKGYLFGCG